MHLCSSPMICARDFEAVDTLNPLAGSALASWSATPPPSHSTHLLLLPLLAIHQERCRVLVRRTPEETSSSIQECRKHAAASRPILHTHTHVGPTPAHVHSLACSFPTMTRAPALVHGCAVPTHADHLAIVLPIHDTRSYKQPKCMPCSVRPPNTHADT